MDLQFVRSPLLAGVSEVPRERLRRGRESRGRAGRMTDSFLEIRRAQHGACAAFPDVGIN